VRVFPRPVVVLSKCLELAACRYNGARVSSPFVQRLAAHVEWRPVCPEVEIGLGVPRDPIRLTGTGRTRRLCQPATGRDVTGAMEAFSDARLASWAGRVDGFILKSRSPSCGIADTKVYADVVDDRPIGTGPGLFGARVLARFPDAAVEDEARLLNAALRHHFLTKLFVRAAFRTLRDHATPVALAAFHASHGLLLTAYDRRAFGTLEGIVAQMSERPLADVMDAYGTHLGRVLRAPARSVSTTLAFAPYPAALRD
jgi:uncharacterized protein YbbK (DUF523 family)